MKSGTARLSDVVREQRMDAAFHIALARVANQVDHLRRHYSIEDVECFFEILRPGDLMGLQVLDWGQDKHCPKIIAEKYPFISMALVLSGELKDAITRAKRIIISEQTYLDQLVELEAFTTGARS